MIQRIQSFYIILVVILCAVMFVLPLSVYRSKVDGVELVIVNRLLVHSGGEAEMASLAVLPEAILSMAVGLISLSAFFFFRRRDLQIRLCRISFLLLTLLIFCLFFFEEQIMKGRFAANEQSSAFLPGSYAPLLAIGFIFLAIRAIRKDDDLVRSADRIR